ncbi:hypothetical protein TthTF19_20980 (plasmid) [Thermus thermophilus]|uniref:Winged helix-turn helix domain-containing protein n=1 Tax=Thermus thermophilus TaxID=274 RepID=A0AAD1KWN6_THETH|nr:hypothetical protein TthAA11_21990 [Thermus thermophilus]BCZ95662.1 hypothetical protein TthAK1_22790 [Thermus thermophilus]
MSAFLRELLAGEEAWTAPRLLEDLERRFFVTFHPGTVRRKLSEIGYGWKRTRYMPTGKARDAFPLGKHLEAERGAEGVLSGCFAKQTPNREQVWALPAFHLRLGEDRGGQGQRSYLEGAPGLGEVGPGERGGTPGDASPGWRGFPRGAGSWGTGFWRGGAGRGRWWPTRRV